MDRNNGVVIVGGGVEVEVGKEGVNGDGQKIKLKNMFKKVYKDKVGNGTKNNSKKAQWFKQNGSLFT